MVDIFVLFTCLAVSNYLPAICTATVKTDTFHWNLQTKDKITYTYKYFWTCERARAEDQSTTIIMITQ